MKGNKLSWGVEAILFALGEPVPWLQPPGIDELGLSRGIDVLIGVSAVGALALAGAQDTALFVFSLFAHGSRLLSRIFLSATPILILRQGQDGCCIKGRGTDCGPFPGYAVGLNHTSVKPSTRLITCAFAASVSLISTSCPA